MVVLSFALAVPSDIFVQRCCSFHRYALWPVLIHNKTSGAVNPFKYFSGFIALRIGLRAVLTDTNSECNIVHCFSRKENGYLALKTKYIYSDLDVELSDSKAGRCLIDRTA
jgi:hypothetical protein